MPEPVSPSPWARKWLLAALVALIMAASVAVRYWFVSPGRPSMVHVPYLVPRVIQIIPGVHLLGSLDPAAAYAVETSEGLVLIDTGIQSGAGSVLEQLVYQNLDWKKLHAILLTHVHADHSGGAQFLRQATGAKVYVGRADAAILRAGEPREAMVGNFALTPKSSLHKTIVDKELDGGETITIGEARFQVFATPGHTPGSVCYLMERNGYKVLFSGDVIISLEDSPAPLSHYQGPFGTYIACRARATVAMPTLSSARSGPYGYCPRQTLFFLGIPGWIRSHKARP